MDAGNVLGPIHLFGVGKGVLLHGANEKTRRAGTCGGRAGVCGRRHPSAYQRRGHRIAPAMPRAWECGASVKNRKAFACAVIINIISLPLVSGKGW